MIEVIREDGETIDKLLRRYNEKLKRTNLFNQVKSSGFRVRKPNKRSRKLSALYKYRKRQKMEYLKRIGKLEYTGREGAYRGYYSQSSSSMDKKIN